MKKKVTGIRINTPKLCKSGKLICWNFLSDFSPICSNFYLLPISFFSTFFIETLISGSLLPNFMDSIQSSFIFLSPSIPLQESLRQILNHLSFFLLGYLGQLNFIVQSKILAQTFGKINPVCGDSLNDI